MPIYPATWVYISICRSVALYVYFYWYIYVYVYDADLSEHLAHHHEYEKEVPHEVPDLTLGSPFSPPKKTWPFVCWLLGLPINALYYFTIPDVRIEKRRKWVIISFVVCIVWIGLTSYVLVWMVTVIGYTFFIPDTVMGLSLVAFGSSVPDCLSSLFVARKGKT